VTGITSSRAFCTTDADTVRVVPIDSLTSVLSSREIL